MADKYLKIFEKTIAERTPLAMSDQEREWIEWKDVHSRRVLEVGREILAKEPQLAYINSNYHEEAIASLLLHDIARFYQFRDGAYIREMIHGRFGAELLTSEHNITSPHIVLGMKYHDILDFDEEILNDDDFKALDDKTKSEVLLIAKLVRDADKLENFLKYKEQNRFGFFEKADKILKIDEVALKEFYEGKLINKSILLRSTIFDCIIYFMAWQNEIYFEASKDYLRNMGFNKMGINLLKTAANDIYKNNESSTSGDFDYIISEIGNIEKFLQERKLI